MSAGRAPAVFDTPLDGAGVLAALAATRPVSVERVAGTGLWDSLDEPIAR